MVEAVELGTLSKQNSNDESTPSSNRIFHAKQNERIIFSRKINFIAVLVLRTTSVVAFPHVPEGVNSWSGDSVGCV